MFEAGLVLEGGGMKGIYTAGILEFFLEKNIEFSAVYGVSAGACHMCSYLSKQKGRAYHVGIDYIGDKNYCGTKSLLTTGDFFNVKMCYTDIPEVLNPYDFDTFNKYEGKAFSVATNIVTGKAEYLQLKDMKTDINMVRASASLPLLSRNVPVGDNLYLDGGISDAIPVHRSIADGQKKNVVVMTKEIGYVRKPLGKAFLAFLKMKYRKYPKVYELMRDRHLAYNALVEDIEKMEKEGKIFLIRPKKPSEVKRLEKDSQKMQLLYEEGYHDAEACYEQMLAYLNN